MNESLGKSVTVRAVWVRRGGYLLLGLFLLAGMAYMLLHTPQIRVNDEKEYLALSGNLRDGLGYSIDGVTLTAYRPPGYAFFVTALQSLGAGVKAIYLVQIGLLGGIILLLTRFGPRAGRFPGVLIAVAMTALYPVEFYLCGRLYPQVFGTFLFLLALVLLLRTPKSRLSLALAGLTFGLLILTIPTFGMTLLVLLAAAWALRMLDGREALLVFVAASLPVGLWTVRNAVEFHRFIPVASSSGVNLMIGNCAEARVDLGGGSVELTHYFEEATNRHLDEFEMDRYFRDVALGWIEENPGQALKYYGVKVINHFALYNQYAPGSGEEIPDWKQAVLAGSYLLLLGLSMWRLTEARRYPLASWEKLFLVIYVGSAFTTAVFFPRIRLRVPYDFLLIAIVTTHAGRRLQPWVEGKSRE